jgi:hypothetical protein
MPAKMKPIDMGADKSNLRTTDDLISKDDRFSDMVKRLGKINSELGDLDENCEGINLSDTYDELKGIIKNLQGYDQVLKLKVEYGKDSDIKTGKDLLEALDPKIDPRAATFDETIRDLFSILYGAVMGAIKEDS